MTDQFDLLKTLMNYYGKKRVYFNKTGTLRYCGYVFFAKGLWCGIELDDDTGDSDGSVNGVHYFSCKENHGIFIPAEGLSITDNDDLSLTDAKIGSWLPNKCNKHVRNVKVKRYKEVEYSLEDLSDFDYDSDESLGILPLHLFEAKNSEAGLISEKNVLVAKDSQFQFDEHFQDILIDEVSVSPFSESFSEQDVFTKLNVVNVNEDKSVLKATDRAFTRHVDSTATSLPEKQKNLNITATFHNLTTDIDKFKIDDQDNLTFACNASEVLSLPPVYSPKYSSTPKHDSSFAFNLDEFQVKRLSARTISPVSDLNKTAIINKKAIEENTEVAKTDKLDDMNQLFNRTVTANAEKERVSEKNILNVTCNVEDFPNASTSALNKTFIFENCKLTFSEKLDSKNKTFNLKEIKNISHCVDMEKNIEYHQDENIQTNISTPVTLSEDFYMPSKEQLDSNIQSSDCFKEKYCKHQVSEDTSAYALNTEMSTSKEFEDKFDTFGTKREKHVVHDRKNLNSSFVKVPQLSNIAKSSKIAKRFYPVPSSNAASSSKHSEFDKNNIRKIDNVPSENILMKENKKRRQTFGSTSTKMSDSVVSQRHKSSLQGIQDPATSGSTSLTTASSPSLDYAISKKCSVKENPTTELGKNKKAMVNSQILPHVPASMSDQAKLYTGNQPKQEKALYLGESSSLIYDLKKTKKMSLKQESLRYKTGMIHSDKVIETEKKIASGIPSLRILSQKNDTDHGLSSAVEQNTGGRNNVSDTPSKDNTAFLRSRIPARNKKKGNEDSSERQKKIPSCRNLR